MVDDRTPGTGEPKAKGYRCGHPGCAEESQEDFPPPCPKHGGKMKPVSTQ